MDISSLSSQQAERLAQYWAGECDATEVAEVEAWLAQDEMRAKVAEQARMMWERSARPVVQGNAAAFAERIHAHVVAKTLPGAISGQAQPRLRRRPVARVMVGMMAAAIVPLVAWYAYTSLPVQSGVYDSRGTQRVESVLPDGSRVQMGPASSVQYTFGRNRRSIELTGEAFFTVVHDLQRPFVVHAGGVTTEVLGTAFGVLQHGERVDIAVVEGKVAVGRGRPATVLSAGMIARVDDSVTVQRTGAEAALAWTRGELVFTEVPVTTMLQTAGKWFGYEFRLADSTLAKRHVTTVLELDKPEEAMTLIASVLNVEIVLHDRVATLHPRRGSRGRAPMASPIKRELRDTYTIPREAGK